jgi:hypothetical protein
MKTWLTRLLIALALLSSVHTQGTTVFPIETNPAVIAYGTGLAFDGTNYLVEGLTGMNTNGVTNVNVQLVSASGTLIGSPISVGGGANLQLLCGLCFGNTNYLVGWSDSTISSGVDIFGQLISRTGVKVGSPFNLLAAQGSHGFQNGKAIASDGTNYLIVWQDDNDNSLWGQLVTPAGTLSGTNFFLGQPQSEVEAALTFGRSNYLFVAQGDFGAVGNSNQVFGEFVSSSGVVGTPFQISQTASTDNSFLTAAFDRTNYLVVWSWNPGPETGMNVTNWQFYARLVSPAGTLPGSELALITGGNQVVPWLAFDGANYLLAYGFDSNTTNSDRYLRCQFLDRSANLVGPLFTPFATQGTNVPLFAFHSLLFDGSRFVMAASLGILGINATNGDLSGISGEVFGAFLPASTASPTLASAGPLTGTQFPLLLSGTPGINYAIQFSTNLALPNWTAFATNSPTNGTLSFTDPNATNKSRFYRAMKQ